MTDSETSNRSVITIDDLLNWVSRDLELDRQLAVLEDLRTPNSRIRALVANLPTLGDRIASLDQLKLDSVGLFQRDPEYLGEPISDVELRIFKSINPEIAKHLEDSPKEEKGPDGLTRPARGSVPESGDSKNHGRG